MVGSSFLIVNKSCLRAIKFSNKSLSTSCCLFFFVFFITNSRIYYVLAGNDPSGRPIAASHQLINAVIEKYAGKALILDFEGSDIPGIAFFFEGFGAKSEQYYYLHNNNLPWVQNPPIRG